MWELDHKESWVLKNWCLLTVVLEKTLESPLDCKESQPVSPKGNQPWIFTGRTDAETEAPKLWPPDAKNWFIGKDPDARKDWRQEEKGTTEDGMVGWHHWLDGHEFEQASGDGNGQGSLACCSPRGRKELNMTDWNEDSLLLDQIGSHVPHQTNSSDGSVLGGRPTPQNKGWDELSQNPMDKEKDNFPKGIISAASKRGRHNLLGRHKQQNPFYLFFFLKI